MASQTESFLVTGGCGLTGSGIVEQLRKKYPTAPVTVMSRNPTINNLPGVVYLAGDITKVQDVRRVLDASRPTVVFHVAGILVAARQHVSPALTHSVNTDGTRIMLEECKRRGREDGFEGPRVKAFVFTSSASVVQKNQRSVAGLDETAPLVTEKDPEALVYALSKAAADKLATEADEPGRDGQEEGMRTCSIRPAVIHGPRDQELTPLIVKMGATMGNTQIGSNTARFAVTYVDNCSQAHMLALGKLLSPVRETRDSVGGEAFFVTNDGENTFFNFAREVWMGAGLPGISTDPKNLRIISTSTALWLAWASEMYAWLFGTPIRMSKISIYMCTMERWYKIDKAKRVLGYKPTVPWEEGAKLAGEWYAKHQQELKAAEAGKKTT